ncbi:MAG: polysaccharide deacetylase [Tissierellia bacterium]|nr:polysaccharide deacetylase [Tissierellia bacterium]
MDNYKKNSRQIYQRRRIVAIIVSSFVLIALIALIGKIFLSTSGKDADGKTKDKILTTSEIKLDESDIDKLVKGTTTLNIFENSEKNISDNLASYKLRPYRLKTIRDQSMGKGPRQSLLKKEVFLTFDDGPSSEVTEKVLDVLKEENVKATFFVIGKNVENYPEILKRIHEEGHGIGIHTYSHNYNEIYASPDALQRDIEACLKSIRNVLGEDFNTILYRFPGGSFRKNKEIFINRVEDLGYIYFDWNVLNGDAEGSNLTEDYLIKRFNETSRGYNILLSLMHDTNAKQNTVNTLPRIIQQLRAEKYEFKSLGDTL